MKNHQIIQKIWPKFEENPCSTTTLETISPMVFHNICHYFFFTEFLDFRKIDLSYF